MFVGTSGLLDDVPVGDVRRFESELLEWFRSRHGGLLTEIRTKGQLPEGDALADAVRDFKASFAPTGAAQSAGTPATAAGDAPHEAHTPETLVTE